MTFGEITESIEKSKEMLKLEIVFTSLIFYGMFAGTDTLFSRTGFLNNFMNDWICRLKLMTEVNSSDSIIESYYNKSGQFCKIYCRLRKINSPAVQYIALNAPEFSVCGPLEFCRNGKCQSCLAQKAPFIQNLFTKINEKLNPNNESSNGSATFGPRTQINDTNGDQIEREEKPSDTSFKADNLNNHAYASSLKPAIRNENSENDEQPR